MSRVPITLTDEQTALVTWVVDPAPIQPHAILEARAGSGKTTTLLLAAQTIIEADEYTTVLVVAFNKRIAEEITVKALRMGLRKPRFIVQTLHACGNAARMSLSEYRNSTLNNYKVSDLVGLRINELMRTNKGGNLAGLNQQAFSTERFRGDCENESNTPKQRVLMPAEDPEFVKRNKTTIESLVDFGRLYGVGIAFQLEDTRVWHTIIERHITLPRSYTGTSSRVSFVSDLLFHACEIIKQVESAASNEHDFIDMLWLPILSGAAFKQYDWVLIDEAQDTNELSRAIGMASLAPEGRMIVVGDPHQCINGFQGADDNGINIMRDALNAVTFPLTISQRCSNAIVAHARAETACKDIRARDDAAQGQIIRMPLHELNMKDLGFLESIADNTAAILCRNNAPLLSIGFTFMREGVPFHIAGGADLYARMLRLATRWKVPDSVTLRMRLEVYRDAEVSRLRGMNASSARIDAVCDEVDMLQTIIKAVEEESEQAYTTLTAVTQKISALKAEQETNGGKGLLLSTIHKAKGLEWDHVYLLGADTLMPSRYATTAFDKSQEDHIRYVAITRARFTLTYLDFNVHEDDVFETNVLEYGKDEADGE